MGLLRGLVVLLLVRPARRQPGGRGLMLDLVDVAKLPDPALRQDRIAD